MKNNKKIVLIIAILVLIIVITSGIIFRKEEPQNVSQEGGQENLDVSEELTNGETEEIEKKEIPIVNEEKQPEETIDEINTIKDNSGKTGDTNLYEVQESYNNTKIVTIKSSVKYKIAFSGIIKNNTPKISEADNILEKNHPKYAGIWVYEKDRENLLNMLKEITNSDYKIDENGYLKIVSKNNQNENDKKIEQAIKSEKLYVITISSTCYIVDEVTGEVLDYNFEKLDRYQTYEYFQDGDKMIIFITENAKKQMTQKEILQSVIDMF